jgi:glycosyltransferase involved in cell wall biosynthesis
MNSKKVISLGFVTLENLDSIQKTFLSIRDLSDIIQEIIVVDSSSNKDISKFCNTEISKYYKLKYIWENPLGIYHAMNTALNAAEANNYIWYLNPGDSLINSNVARQLLTKIQNTNSIWGYAQAQKKVGESIEIFPKTDLIANLSNIARGSLSISHQSMLTSVCELRRLSGFDEKYSIAADLKVQIELSRNFKSESVLTPLVEIDPHGISHKKVMRTFLETSAIRFRTSKFSKLETISLGIKFIALKTYRKIINISRVIK